MKGIASSLITAVLILGVIFLFVRPGSNGVSFISAIGTSLTNLFGAVTGGSSWNAKG